MEEKKQAFDLKELQLKELEILQEVDRICKKHQLTYFLAYGSALGAVRHHGFIPWDDDIDIYMKLEDYEKFKSLCKTELDKQFFYQDIDTDPYVHMLWAKIRMNNTTSMVRDMSDYPIHWGICIDIFPLVPFRVKETSKLDHFSFKLMNLCANKKLNQYGYGRYGVETNKVNFIPSCLCQWLYHKARAYVMRDRHGNQYYFACGIGLVEQRIYDGSIFEDTILMEFDGFKLPVMKGYDQYLRQTYGNNYMELPKKEERINHGDIIVDFNHDYHKYMTKRKGSE